MKIVHVVATADGAPWMIALAREQMRRGHEVAVVLPSLDGTIGRELSKFGIAAHSVPLDVLSGTTWSRMRKLAALVRMLQRLRPDVVHSHILPSVIAARLASWIADAPAHFAGNVHPLTLEWEKLRELEVGTAFLDAKTIASCSYTRELFLQYGVPEEQLAMVHYAVDQSAHDPARADGSRVRRELGIDERTPVVGMVAYFYPPSRGSVPATLRGRGIKGHDVLIRAIPKVIAEIPDARFLLVGRGWGTEGERYEVTLRSLVAELGVERSVIFTGERSDVADVLAAFDVSVHCSLSENLGGSVESLLMERPMIVSDAPGFRDTVLHEETGLVVPRDDPGALAQAIIRLLRDRQFARRLGVNGRARMLGAFTLEHSVDGIESLLKEVKPRAVERYRRRVTMARALWAPFRIFPIWWRTRRAMRQSR